MTSNGGDEGGDFGPFSADLSYLLENVTMGIRLKESRT